jgi:glycosyltransferase 2 family protein
MLKNISIKHITKIIPIIGLFLLAYIIYTIGIEKIILSFSEIPWYYYLIALIVFLPKLFLSVVKWKYICDKQKIPTNIFDLIRLFLIGMVFGAVTPGGLGLHIRIYYLREQSKTTFEKCLANSIIDGTLNLLAGVLIAVIGSVMIFSRFPSFLPIILGFFLLYLAAFIFFMEKHRGSTFLNFIIKPFIPKKFKTNLDNAMDMMYEDLPSLSQTILPFLLEIIIWVIAATQVYILALSFDLPIPYLDFILISTISVVISNMIPVSIGGLGIREGVFVVFLSSYGIPQEIAFVLSLAGFLVKTLIPGLIGLLLFVATGNRFIPNKDVWNDQLRGE